MYNEDMIQRVKSDLLETREETARLLINLDILIDMLNNAKTQEDYDKYNDAAYMLTENFEHLEVF